MAKMYNVDKETGAISILASEGEVFIAPPDQTNERSHSRGGRRRPRQNGDHSHTCTEVAHMSSLRH